MGESRWPYSMKPSLRRPDERYRELKASRRSRSLPSVPFSNAVGRDIHDGIIVPGAGP